MDKNSLIQKLARESNEKGVFNGAWLYAEKGEIVSKGAYGFRDAENRLPMEETSIFDLASVTKQFTAAAVMLLIKRGIIGLEDEIAKFFPKLSFPGVTVRHLLTHTSGIPEPADENFFGKTWEREHRIPDNCDALRFLEEGGMSPCSAPGEEFCYTNANYMLLAQIVEQVSGSSFEDFMRREIFEPCGMDSTGIYHIRVNGVPSDRFVRNMVLEDERFILPEESVHERDVIAADGTNGDGFVYSTVLDMFKWDRALREGKLLSPDEQKLMYTPAELNNGEPAYDDEEAGVCYGFGWCIESDPALGLIVNHSGWHKGATSWFERFVDADRMLIILWSRDASDDTAYDSFVKGMRNIAKDMEPGPIRTIEEVAVKDPDKSNWESFCGKFAHEEGDCFYPDEVYLREGELYVRFIQAARGELVSRLYPLGGNEFGMKHFSFKVQLGDGTFTMFGDEYKRV